MPLDLQLVPQLQVVENFAIIRDPATLVIRHRLVAVGGEIEYRQTAIP